MVSVRPVSMKRMVSAIKALEKLGCTSAEVLAEQLNVTAEYSAEVLRFLKDLGLVQISHDCYYVSEKGLRFALAFEEGNSDFIEAVFSEIPGYTRVVECVEMGYARPLEVAKCAGTSVFRADVLLRLHREVRGIARASLKTAVIDQDVFDRAVFEVYLELSRRRRARYVHLEELLVLLASRLGVNIETAIQMLENTVRKHRSRILLTRSPMVSGIKPVLICGKPYTHLAVF